MYYKQTCLLLAFMLCSALITRANDSASQDIRNTLEPNLELTAEMEAFLEEHEVRKSITTQQKINRILEGLFLEDELGFQYHPRLTVPPQIAFKERKGNCLTFAMLFVTLGRAAGLDVRFNELDFAPKWEREGHLIVECGHINTIVKTDQNQYVVEWLDNFKSIAKDSINPISDKRAFSHYYGNLALMALTQNKMPEAHFHLEKGLEWDPENEIIWQNFGVYWFQQGDMERGEESLIKASKIGNETSSVYFLLSDLYERKGQHQKAKTFAKLGKKSSQKNPFYHQKLAQKAKESEDYKAAYKHLKKAIKIFPNYIKFQEEYAFCIFKANKVTSIEEGLVKANRIASIARKDSSSRNNTQNSIEYELELNLFE